MKDMLRRTAIISTIVALSFTAACANGTNIRKPGTQGDQFNPQSRSQSQSQIQGTKVLANEDAVIPVTTINQGKYIPIKELANVLEFNLNWEDTTRKLQLGDNDANFELNIDSNRARKDGNEITVDRPFVLQEGAAYLPLSALADLFQEDISFDVNDSEVRIHPSPHIPSAAIDDETANPATTELDFAEDQADPFKGTDEAAGSIDHTSAWAQEEDAIPVLKNIDINGLIRKGKQYLGVKYLFGAGPYAKTGRFDCSTFTQYVFGKYGIKLPRLSREQAQVGTYVSRKNLRKGDMMFFYVPGRFKTNKTVGHVAMYIGNMQMLHSSPKPKNGVQITSINKEYWKETFLKARRVAY